jgi:hypothetical protein
LRDIHIREFNLPFKANPSPKTFTYYEARKIVASFRERLHVAETTLASVSDADAKLPLHFGMIQLDLNGDNKTGEQETLWKLYASMSRNRNISADRSKQFSIAFDRGDVHWLRGYCHLIMAACEIYLAHDTRETFDRTAHVLFTNVESPYAYLGKGKRVWDLSNSETDILDVIALIHTINWQVAEPHRMEAALRHLEAMVDQSRFTWKRIMAETDDDHEWLPNPEQTGVIPNVRVTKEMVTTWSEIMNQIDKILAGELLIAFWRGDEASQGINLRKVFLEPRTFDLVLWVQGSAAKPYLQKGKVTKGKTWDDLMGVFGGNFPGFAAWFQ